MSVIKSQDHAWWKEASVYQVYPASFCDGNGDGWGDIPGITSKLDHLKDLGIDVLWCSPIFKSPQVDMGYDISDYCDIDPRYGTIADVDDLIAELKKRDMKLMMDLVVNHTSDQHAWFLESRSSRANPKRDWYIWKPAKYSPTGERLPPNNWSMILGEHNSAWTWDEHTQEYYLALFTPEQPDLNWETPAVRNAVIAVMNFWLDRGAAGFRMDVINHISKDQRFPDAPISQPGFPYQPGDAFFANGPRLHEFLRELHTHSLGPHSAMTVGEMPFVCDPNEILNVVAAPRNELNMIFIFDLVTLDNASGWRMSLQPWHPRDVKASIAKWQHIMRAGNGWNSLFVENHDNPRAISRFCDDSPQFREVGAKLLALMLTTLSGTPFVYQGQEIGMRNLPADTPVAEFKDIETINYWRKAHSLAASSSSTKRDDPRHIIAHKARDHARTPIPWTSSGPTAGFSPDQSCTPPWMLINPDYSTVNIAAQRSPSLSSSNATNGLTNGTAPTHPPPRTTDGALNNLSPLLFYRRALRQRKAHKDVFVYGDFALLSNTLLSSSSAEDDATIAYVRTSEAEPSTAKFVVLLNFSGESARFGVPTVSEETAMGGKVAVKVGRWVAGTYYGEGHGSEVKIEKATEGVVELRAWEGLLGVCA